MCLENLLCLMKLLHFHPKREINKHIIHGALSVFTCDNHRNVLFGTKNIGWQLSFNECYLICCLRLLTHLASLILMPSSWLYRWGNRLTTIVWLAKLVSVRARAGSDSKASYLTLHHRSAYNAVFYLMLRLSGLAAKYYCSHNMPLIRYFLQNPDSGMIIFLSFLLYFPHFYVGKI